MRENDIGNYLDVVGVRMTEAIDVLDEAKLLFDNQKYLGTANRLYYSIFKAISAVHNLDGNKFKTHKDALGQFNKLYIHTGVFPKEFGSKIYKIQEIRQEADYGARPRLKKEMLEEYLAFTTKFVDTLKTYCDNGLRPSLKRFKNLYEAFKKDFNNAGTDICLNFIKKIIKSYGTDSSVLNLAIEAVTDIEKETPEFTSKLLNETLKTEEYKKALDKEQYKTAENIR